jgi:hypothetical protein
MFYLDWPVAYLSLCLFDVDRIQTFLTSLDGIFNFIVLAHLINQSRSVDKNIFAPIIGFNETKSFAIIKKFHSSCCHSWLKVS